MATLLIALGIWSFQRIVREEHVTMLLASHDPLVDAYVDDVLQMKDGQLM